MQLDDITNSLLQLERTCKSTPAPSVATHMLLLLVRGLTISLRFPLAQFPTTSVTAYELYSLVTEAVLRLEMLGFKVICLTSNGASPNRKLYRRLATNCISDDMVPFKMENMYSDENRAVYLMSDVPHLLKTTRNSWTNSHAHSCSRQLQVSYMVCMLYLAYKHVCVVQINGKDISWQHLIKVYKANAGQCTDTPGLVLLLRV